MENIHTCISYQASAAAKVIARLSRTRLTPFGVTPIQFAVLQAVSEGRDPTAADVGAVLMIDSATIVGVLDRLVSMDLLRRDRDPADRRVYRLVLTDFGAARLPEMQGAMDALNAEVDAALLASSAQVRAGLQALAALENPREV